MVIMVHVHNNPQIVQVNINLTITDDETDFALNPDGSFPTKEDIAVDAMINTRTHVVRNEDTGEWQRVTTRHAPFGMPLSQQQGDKWWLAAPSPRLVALEEQADADIRRSLDNLRLRVQFEQARHAYTHAVDNTRRMMLQYLHNELHMARLRVQMAIVQAEIIRERAARAARAAWARRQAAQQQDQAGGGDEVGSDDDSNGDDSSVDGSSFDDSLFDGSSDDDNSTDASSFDGQEL